MNTCDRPQIIKNETLIIKIIEWTQKHNKEFDKLTQYDVEDAMRSKGLL